ncbi:MAG: DUF3108 domain-containing protein [Ignavibacteriales bacterium CG07_land_8_20_14_0_80_59_12]|nr:MAG: DUF3108 domain-containing protein [Ignavibacteriales bacterium CG07_land_8_20_14_0_80_59_12]
MRYAYAAAAGIMVSTGLFVAAQLAGPLQPAGAGNGHPALVRGESAKQTPLPLRRIPNTAFNAGEKLSFDVKFGFVKAGEASLAIPEVRDMQGTGAFRVVFRVNSTSAFSWVFRVEDRYETFVDTSGIFSWRFEQHIREGGYRRDFSADFDQVNHKAYTTGGTYPIPPFVQDIMSSFYYVRTLDFSKSKPGDRFHMENFYKDTTYALDVKFLGRETVRTGAGTFRCAVVEPMVREGGLFKSEGRIIVYLSDDERKIPVKVSTQVVIGSIDGVLREYRGIGPLASRVE